LGLGAVGCFSHGWPLNADAWDDQLFFIASHGYRAIAHDRRGHGRRQWPVAPLMLKTEANPGGTPIAAFDAIRASVAADRSQFYMDLSLPFYGYNRPGANISEGVRDAFWLMSIAVGLNAAYDWVKAFSETDLTEDLKKLDVPTLIVHREDDQIVPIGASALLSSKLVRNATLNIYPGAPHGIPTTHKDRLNADLLAFLKSQETTATAVESPAPR
jgi:non-heme chloroperoxidase